MRLLGYALVTLALLSATLWWYEMVRDVNGRLSADKRFSFFTSGSPGRMAELWRTHTRLYPNSKVRLAHLLSLLGAFVLLLIFHSRL